MVDQTLTTREKIQRAALDSGEYFRQMMDFVGFTPDDAAAVHESGLVIEKHIPSIVADFYTHLLRYPPTRKHFLRPDGAIDLDYLEKRMHHLTNFWRRTAQANFDDDYARYIDYVGLAHTSRGADPSIYIDERYVIGQVGFMQRAISKAISDELHEIDPNLERKANRAWNLLMMVILELLARAYKSEDNAQPDAIRHGVDSDQVKQLAVETYERGLGLYQSNDYQEIAVGSVNEIPEGSRKIVELGELSIGVFHHQGDWIALRNHCLHAGGPVATGELEGDTLICPWHGFRYCVLNGELLIDPGAKLEKYDVILRDNQVFVKVPVESPLPFETTSQGSTTGETRLKPNEFLLKQVPPGGMQVVFLKGEAVTVCNLDGQFFAFSNSCTHAGGPLNEGKLDGKMVVCPWHGSCFDVTNGAVLCGPAQEPLRTYRVILEGEIGRVE